MANGSQTGVNIQRPSLQMQSPLSQAPFVSFGKPVEDQASRRSMADNFKMSRLRSALDRLNAAAAQFVGASKAWRDQKTDILQVKTAFAGLVGAAVDTQSAAQSISVSSPRLSVSAQNDIDHGMNSGVFSIGAVVEEITKMEAMSENGDPSAKAFMAFSKVTSTNWQDSIRATAIRMTEELTRRRADPDKERDQAPAYKPN
jgi:hypothetical protein